MQEEEEVQVVQVVLLMELVVPWSWWSRTKRTIEPRS